MSHVATQTAAATDLLTPHQLAQRLGVSRRSVFRWIGRRGIFGLRLPTVAVGSRRYVTLAGYEAWQTEVERRRPLKPSPEDLLETSIARSLAEVESL